MKDYGMTSFGLKRADEASFLKARKTVQYNHVL